MLTLPRYCARVGAASAARKTIAKIKTARTRWSNHRRHPGGRVITLLELARFENSITSPLLIKIKSSHASKRALDPDIRFLDVRGVVPADEPRAYALARHHHAAAGACGLVKAHESEHLIFEDAENSNPRRRSGIAGRCDNRIVGGGSRGRCAVHQYAPDEVTRAFHPSTSYEIIGDGFDHAVAARRHDVGNDDHGRADRGHERVVVLVDVLPVRGRINPRGEVRAVAGDRGIVRASIVSRQVGSV